MDQFMVLKQDDARSGTSKSYWIESAKRLGLVDTDKGVSNVVPSALRVSLIMFLISLVF
jgi:hypothetical protein